MMLKLLSTSPQFYRTLGNRLGVEMRLRKGISSFYGKRAKQLVTWCKEYGVLEDGGSVLEIGAGWVHFESIVLRLFFDIQATLFDIWDNRQLAALKRYSILLEELLYQEMALDLAQKQRISQLIEIIQ